MHIDVGLIWLVSYREAASFITSKFLEHNTENEEFEKSRVLQKCPLTHITLIIIIIRRRRRRRRIRIRIRIRIVIIITIIIIVIIMMILIIIIILMIINNLVNK